MKGGDLMEVSLQCRRFFEHTNVFACESTNDVETPKERRKWGDPAISTLPNLPLSENQRWQLQHEQ